MEFLDARRLTGPNLLGDFPGSILDISCEPGDAESVVERWSGIVRHVLDALGWENERLYSKVLSGGVSLAFSAPIDVLYTATAVNEYAWAVLNGADDEGNPPPSIDAAIAGFEKALIEERNPRLIDIQSAAAGHGVPFLWDDDEVSLGHGATADVYPFRDLPPPSDVDWSRYGDVPLGIVTGTNGKTTTVRLATFIARSAGQRVGVSCTDWIAVDDDIIDRGDWSGPGGARTVLRQRGVNLAILEAARGGLLRRGLGVSQATAALVTNIAEDHLGDFGSRNLQELLDIKWVVSRAVREAGVLVLNADDRLLTAKASDYQGELVWFSLDAGNPLIEAHLERGGTAFVLDDGVLYKRHRDLSGDRNERLVPSAEIPIAMHGAAKHNLANALAAAALTDALGVPLADIRHGLRNMTQEDNPGRCNIYAAGGVQLLVDFAHNPAAMQSLFDMATALPAQRRLLAFGQAGDRTDELITSLARSAWDIGLDAVVVSELAEYHRGREHGEVYRLIREELVANGAESAQVHHFEQEIDSLDFAIDWAQPGDLIILLDLGRSDAVQARLESFASS